MAPARGACLCLLAIVGVLAAVDEEQQQLRQLTGWKVTFQEGRPSSATPSSATPVIVDHSSAAHQLASSARAADHGREISETADARRENPSHGEGFSRRDARREADASSALPPPTPAPASEPPAPTPAPVPPATTPVPTPTPDPATAAPAITETVTKALALPRTTLTTTAAVSNPVPSPSKAFLPATKADANAGPSTMVARSVAMCDSLACPAGYELRPSAFEKTCAALETCSLDVDLATCCHQEVSWWTYMLAEFAFFCVLSMLCSFIGGLVHLYLPMPSERGSRQESKSKEISKDREEEEPLGSAKTSDRVTTALPGVLPALPATMPLVATTGSYSFATADSYSFARPSTMPSMANTQTVFPGVPMVGAFTFA